MNSGKPMTLKKQLFKYVAKMVLLLFTLLLVTLLFFTVGFSAGLLREANYFEKRIDEAASAIAEADSFDPELIPEHLEYVLLEKGSLEVLSANMRDPRIQEAIRMARGDASPLFGQDFYHMIDRGDELCLIHYRLVIQFSDPLLRQWIPTPALVYAIVVIVLMIIGLYVLSRDFLRQMYAEIHKLNVVTEQIKREELDFHLEPSSLQEFQHILDSLDSLRIALRNSLIQQIEQEKSKREQISALAHDIKIPVTIIRGNAELITYQHDNEQAVYEYAGEIGNAAKQIEAYTQLLVQLSRSADSFALNKQPQSINEFLQQLQQEAKALIGQRQVAFELVNELDPGLMISMDTSHMNRAFMNVIMNAIERTGEGTCVTLQAMLREEEVCFLITDQGPGFTEEALTRGKEAFYTEDASRSQEGHYGIGLSFADKVIQAHGGSLELCNASSGQGGQVVIRLPISTRPN